MSFLYLPNPWCEWCDVWRLTTPPGSTFPTLFKQWCGFFYVPQEPDKCKCLSRTYGFSPLSEKTRKSNRLQMSLQRQLFLLSYLKTLSVGPTGVQTRDLPLSRPALSHAWMKLNMYQWWPEKRINNTTLKKKKINQRCLHPFQLDLARRLVPAVLPLPTHNKHIISPILFREISINFYKVYLTFRQQSSITYIVYVHILYSASNKMDKDFLV